MNKFKLYFDKLIDEKSVSALINNEFSLGEVELIKIEEDKNGIMYALISASKDVPVGVLKLMGNRKLSVTSVIKA